MFRGLYCPSPIGGIRVCAPSKTRMIDLIALRGLPFTFVALSGKPTTLRALLLSRFLPCRPGWSARPIAGSQAKATPPIS